MMAASNLIIFMKTVKVDRQLSYIELVIPIRILNLDRVKTGKGIRFYVSQL
jgi:hypothetical protein